MNWPEVPEIEIKTTQIRELRLTLAILQGGITIYVLTLLKLELALGERESVNFELGM
jgi:hypothetical protein